MSSVAKNTITITLAAIAQKVVAFVYFILVARSLGVVNTGKYSAALAFTTIFVVGVDLGINNVFIREAARAKSDVPWYISRIMGMKLLFGVITYGIMFLSLSLLQYDDMMRQLILISGVTMIFDSLHLTLYGALRVEGDLKYEAIGMVLSQCTTAIVGGIGILLHFSLPWFMVAFLVASSINVLFATCVLRFKYHISWWPKLDIALLRRFVVMAFPFALAALFFRVYSYIDTILILKLTGEAAAGWYSIPNKIVNAFVFIPLALSAATYPRLSEYFANNRVEMQRIWGGSIIYILFFVTPIVAGGFALADILIPTVFGSEYIHSVTPLRWLLISMLVSYTTYPIGSCLNAGNEQTRHTKIVGLVMVIDLLINFLLIPRFGATGAGIAALISNTVYVTLGLFALRRIFSLRGTHVVSRVLRILISGLFMGTVVYFLHLHVSLIVGLIVGALLYPLLLFISRACTKQDVQDVWRLIRRV